MRLGSFPPLLLAAALSSPALWHAIVARDIDAKTALSRFLIAVPIAWIMLKLLNSLAKWYGAEPKPPLKVTAVTGDPIPQRRAEDEPR